MQYLWSPWRMEYIESENREEDCVFCIEPSREDCEESLIIHRGKKAYVILNRYPYTSGHLMIVPYEHRSSLEDLEPETRSEMMELATKAVRVLKATYHPQGFNIGFNLGTAAGAGIAEHIHMHIVPRWVGDTNFMSTLGETRVLPEGLGETCERIHQGWEAGE